MEAHRPLNTCANIMTGNRSRDRTCVHGKTIVAGLQAHGTKVLFTFANSAVVALLFLYGCADVRSLQFASRSHLLPIKSNEDSLHITLVSSRPLTSLFLRS